jgi:Undecaprenyl-phosphate galactose phosphotransferase WbaP
MQQSGNGKKIQICRAVLCFSDILAVFLPASFIYNFVEKTDFEKQFRLFVFVTIFIFATATIFCSHIIYQHYTVRRSLYDELKELFHLSLLNSLGSLSVVFLFNLSVERGKHVLYLTMVSLALPLFRYISRRIIDYLGFWRLNAILFCPSAEFEYAKSAIESQFNLGFDVKQSSLQNKLLMRLIESIDKSNSANLNSIRSRLNYYYKKIGSPHVIIFGDYTSVNYLSRIVELLTLHRITYSIIPDIGGASLVGMRTSHFFRWELILLTPQNNIDRLSNQIIKRIFDLCFSVIFILVMLLPMAIIFLIIRLDGGPAIYFHDRVGRSGVKFRCFKFRTMKLNSDIILSNYLLNNGMAQREWQATHKLKDDPRVTGIGKFLRMTSLDELPQFFNVLRGDMSIVGPRPIVEQEIIKYSHNIEMYYKVLPGITGIWQISGRNNTSYQYRVNLDVWYIKNWSLWYDIGIIFKTVSVVINKTGAY